MNKDKQQNLDKAIESQVNQSLDASIDNLSPDIRRKLNRIRIEAAEKKPRRFNFLQTASALSISLAIFWGLMLTPTETPVTEEIYAEVLQEDLEMLDDLEFIYWMVEAEESALL